MSEGMCASSTAAHRLHHAEHSSDFSHCVRQKPLKRRGLSKFYTSKSQSFSSLELALTTQFGESALGLAKRPSSQDLVNAVHHVLSTAGGTLDVGDLCLFQDRTNSMDTRSSCMLQHSHSLTTGGSSLREASSLTSSGGGASGQSYRDGTQSYGGSGGSGAFGDSVATSAPCCPSPRDSPLPSCDICLPSWLHRSTEELCAALHSASIARDGGASGSGVSMTFPAAQRLVMSSPHCFGGSGGWAAAANHALHRHEADVGGPQQHLAGLRREHC